jgi:hypothetical protein
MLDFTVQDLIGTQPDGVPITFDLEIRIHMRIVKGRVPSEVAENIPVTITGHNGVEDGLPVLGSVDVPLTEQASFEIPKLLKQNK